MQKRRKLSAEFKAKVALEVLKEKQTSQQLAQRYELPPNQISTWKQEFLENSSAAFEKEKETSQEADIEKLYVRIGRLELEKEFLKKRRGAAPLDKLVL